MTTKTATEDINNKYKINSTVKADVQQLRDWLKAQSHLPHEYITDLDLLTAHHSCGYRMEVTKGVIDMNYTLRNMFTFYKNRSIDNSLANAFKCWLITPLSTASHKGFKPIYCQLLNPDPQQFVYSDVVRAFVMVIDLCIYEEATMHGISVIINMDKVTISHMSRVDLLVAQEFFYFLQEAMFVRLKEFHFINAPSFMDKLLSMFKPFMKEELLNMLHIHQSGTRSLNDFVPLTALPKDAGGKNLESGLLKDEIWNKIEANQLFFTMESKKTVNESLRPGGPKTMNDIFPSLESSFKKLEID